MNGIDLAIKVVRSVLLNVEHVLLTFLYLEAMFSFLFDTSLCNMAKLYEEACGHYNKRHKKGLLNHTSRRQLASKLTTKAAARTYALSPGIRPGCRTVLSNVIAKASQLQVEGSEAVPHTQTSGTQHHGELVKGDKQNTCKACQVNRRYASKWARPRTSSR